jgi:hypothetical protein
MLGIAIPPAGAEQLYTYADTYNIYVVCISMALLLQYVPKAPGRVHTTVNGLTDACLCGTEECRVVSQSYRFLPILSDSCRPSLSLADTR